MVTSKRGHFNDFTAHSDMHDLKPSTNNACAFEQRNNLLGRRIGAPAALASIMVVWSACALSFPLLAKVTDPIPAFYLLRVLLGAAEGGLIPLVYLCLSSVLSRPLRLR